MCSNLIAAAPRLLIHEFHPANTGLTPGNMATAEGRADDDGRMADY